MVFGLQPFEIGINIQCPLYQPVEFYGATFLFADTLAALEPDKTLKTRLWQALQQLFL
ncbi:MAG: hypothetical protein JNK89_01040 [Saprospiraceae bacterium]|nr:hypothetical protein [Saprospiraceae bacterium]